MTHLQHAATLRLAILTPLRQASLQPEQAVNILNDRVDLIKKINNDIADWLQVSNTRATSRNGG
jgi:hypothetical protein